MDFDYVIVGGGSAGCVLANRLSQNPDHSVLLIERGGRDTSPWIHIPATFFKVIGKGRDVHFYTSDADEGLGGRSTIVPQGNVIGGGSSLNAMVYIRGSAADYDHWANLGCTEWSYAKVLPVFRDLEGNQRLSNGFHGAHGPLKVSDRRFGHPLSWAFIRAAQEAGLSHNDDFNGPHQEGVGYYQTTTFEGRRWSSARAFLTEACKRRNLAVMTNAEVARIKFDGRRVIGVALVDGREVKVRREVVLSAGGVASPKLLQLSGIGDAKHLKAHGIEVVSHLPGVGENYQDHLEATVQGEAIGPIAMVGQDKGAVAARHMLQYLLTRTGLLTSTIVESGGFADTNGDGIPDVQFHVLPSFTGFADRQPRPGHGISINPCFLRPRSRGTVKLRSSDARDPADFRANSLAVQEDVDTLVRGVRLAMKILDAPSLKALMKRRVMPEIGLENDDAALGSYVRSVAKTVFHPSGTCKMGVDGDPMAVVNQKLSVRGVEGLRVADTSIFPTLVSGNTNAPAMMIGERAARFMLRRT
jgi:choline dehydrogenase-like flavoprotein